MSFNTEIANITLGHLGVSKEILDIDTEQSREAKTIRRFWDICLSQVLRDHPFNFASKVISLNLLETDPNTDWLFSYRYPADCLFIKKILSGVNITTQADQIVYKISRDSSARTVLTNQQDATIEYTTSDLDYDNMPHDFKMAFSFRLAFYCAPTLTSSDQMAIKKSCFDAYLIEISKAQANSINEESNDPDISSELERSRI